MSKDLDAANELALYSFERYRDERARADAALLLLQMRGVAFSQDEFDKLAAAARADQDRALRSVLLTAEDPAHATTIRLMLKALGRPEK